MPRFSRLGPGDRFRALVGAQVSQDPGRVDTALDKGIEIVGQPRGLARQQIKNEYETFRMLAGDPVRLQAYATQVLDRAARSSGLTVAELKTSVAQAMRDGLDAAEVVPADAMRAAREVEGIDHELLAEALAELDALVGLEPIKAFVHKLVEDATWDALIGKNAEDIEDPFGDEPEEKSSALRHLRIAGNPGAGKTTAVGVLGKVYKALGKVSKGHVHKVDAKDLIAEYLGQTVKKTTDAFEQARGGIFFIDDVQTILPSGGGGNGDQYNKEALDTLLGFAMEHDVLIAIATYPDRMDDFIGYDPGFKSRFPTVVDFPDFAPGQLTEIFERLCHANKIDYSAETLDKVDKLFKGLKLTRNFGNARLVNNCFGDWIQNQRTRVLAARDGDDPPTGVDIKTILPEDVTAPSGGDVVTIGGGGMRTREDVHAALDGCVVGHAAAKSALSDAVFERMHLRAAGKGTQKPVGFHFFAGPSGVGKTEIAKGLASTCYGGNLEVIDCSKLTSLQAVEAMVHGRLAALDGKSSVVLLDEVEKAHPALFTHLLRVADEGKLMQMSGDADLSSCHFIMTSNLGNPQGLFDGVDPRSEMGEYADPAKVEAGFTELFDAALPAEFKGRLSEDPIVFRPLGTGALSQILEGTLEKLVQVQARAYDRSVEVSPDLKAKLVELGHDPRLGARPMERVVRRQVLLPFLEAMVLQPDQHPAGHVLRFSLGAHEQPKIASKADPELAAAAQAKEKANADAEIALTRAFSIETLTAMVEAESDDTEALAEQLGRLHAALPKAIDTMGFGPGFASLMKEMSEQPVPGLVRAVAEHAVEAQRWNLSTRWPLSVASRARSLARAAEDELPEAELAKILDATVDACGRRLDPGRAAAKAELARSLGEVRAEGGDDGEIAYHRLAHAIERARALDSLSSELGANYPDWGVLQKGLRTLAEANREGTPARPLAEGIEWLEANGDYQASGHDYNLAAAGLAVKWYSGAELPTNEEQRADLRDAFVQMVQGTAAEAAVPHAAAASWALVTLQGLLRADPHGDLQNAALEEAMALGQYGPIAAHWKNIAVVTAETLGVPAALTAQLEACADVAVARDGFQVFDRYGAADEARAALEGFIEARPRGDAQAKLLKRLLKLATAEGAGDDNREDAFVDLALDVAGAFRVGHEADAVEVGDRLRALVMDRIGRVGDHTGIEAFVKFGQGVIDAAKFIYPKDAPEGAWAKQAGAQLARKSDDEKSDILWATFQPEDG